jgi:hypothetical protein
VRNTRKERAVPHPIRSLRFVLRAVRGLLALGLAWGGAAAAQGLPVYTDALQSGFANYSYGAPAPDFAHAATVRSGAASIAFTPGGFNAVSFAHETQVFAPAQQRGLRLFVHGGASGGQQLTVNVYSALGTVAASAPLAGYVAGGGLAAGQWREAVVVFADPPLSYAGSFVRVDLQDGGTGAAQPTLYLDDVSLLPASVALFDDGFEGAEPAAQCGLLAERDVVVAALLSDRFTWCDAAGKPRSAVLAHNDGQVGQNGTRGGALREFRYRMPNDSERIAGVTTYGNGGYGGFGYMVAHAKGSACVGDDSPLGHGFPGQFQRVFEGRHHAIFRFTQDYPRNCSTVNAMARTVPITIEWTFATGRDHPLWSLTYDMSQYGAGLFNDDSRAPYGELNIDGDGFAAAIDGVAWGDRFKFASTTAPVSLSSAWSWNAANSVPYIKLWMVAQDATMGLVQSQPLDQHDAGGGRNPGAAEYDVTDFWGKTSADGDAGPGYPMPFQNEWPYQANAFSIGVGAPNNNARLTWGAQYGFLGQAAYAVNDGVVATAPGWPKQSYSVFVILGPHSTAPVEAQVAQVETVQGVVASAQLGSVDLAGAPGVNRAGDADVTYAPAGWDHVRAAWAFNAAGDALDANLAVGAGTLRRPLLILRGYARAALPATLRFNGVALQRDVDWFPSVRSDAQELWITLNRDLAGANNRIEVVP